MTDVMGYRCSMCGLTAKRALIFAMFRELGAFTSIDPIKCDSGEHDFQPPAQGIVSREASETALAGSTEGQSPVGNADAP